MSACGTPARAVVLLATLTSVVSFSAPAGLLGLRSSKGLAACWGSGLGKPHSSQYSSAARLAASRGGQGPGRRRAGALSLVSEGGRKFQFVPHGQEYSGPEPSICADGLVEGTTLQLTHWQNNKTPAEYKEDLSTEIALRWSKLLDEDDQEWADATVVNNHFDTDGLMTVWALLHPKLAKKWASRMVSAAAAGDFLEWGLGDAGVMLDIAFTRLGEEAGSDEAAYETLLPRVEEFLMGIEGMDHLWKEELAELHEAFDLVADGAVVCSRVSDDGGSYSHASGSIGDIGIMVHPAGVAASPGLVVSRTFPQTMPGLGKGVARILVATQRSEQLGGGFSYIYERPAYAWAETVYRPTIREADAAAIQEVLGGEWTTKNLRGMTSIVMTVGAVQTAPEEMARLLIGAERSLLTRLA
ncbi:hypothetical protein T484DRAFT_1976363 [Baffinella frigidus]|nr:hypothetical protein T484DRAFT_1976363 [Cryptophyta sp. CCMP2293]